jgi:putative transposase
MNVTATTVTNAANLSLFMVNLVDVLLRDLRETDPHCSVLDLKAYCRGYKYVTETIKLLPEKPAESLVVRIFRQVASLGRIHPPESQFKAA